MNDKLTAVVNAGTEPDWDVIAPKRTGDPLARLVSEYVDKIMVPGIPVVSTSHWTLLGLYDLYTKEIVDAEVDRQLKERRA